MMKKMLFGIISIMFLVTIGLQPVLAASNAELEKRIEELEKQPQSSSEIIRKISDRITIFGAIELDYSYTDDDDISNNTNNSSSSDLDVGTVELGLEAILHDYVTANFLLKGEALDSDPTIFWDEAFFTIQKDGFPVYFVGGKTYLPFGLFESQLINDTTTCELYEINKTGVTVGATFGPLGIDVSATVYKGEVLMDRVSDADFGFERDNTPGYAAADKINSYILNFTISPIENLTLATYFNSETGDDERNTTAGLSAHYEIAKFIIDGEYITALNREKHFTDNKKYNESAWFASIGYQIIDPLIAAVRYEGFNDDQSGDQDEHLEYRYSIGATYTLFTKNSFACNLSCEYRKSEYERSAGSGADNSLDELFAQLAIEF
jgi:hypothetical protein